MIRKIGWTLLTGFLAINIIAFMHAYRFTHFSDTEKSRTDPKNLSAGTKARVLLLGIDNPKPRPYCKPDTFTTVHIKSDVILETWHITVPRAKGTVILFHGYSGEKSSLVTRSDEFNRLGYNTLLVDFMGSGGSQGNSTNLGFTESREVKDCYDYLHLQGETEIHLFGTSMGAAAIIKAIDDYRLQPASIILECPFGSLYQTVSARFKIMGVPSFPLAGMLTFWGGFQQGYWAFSHNPSEYAGNVKCPTLVLYGEKDDRVSMAEIQEIFNNLGGPKKLIVYPDQDHFIYNEGNATQWASDVGAFLESASPAPSARVSD
jgi:uncharacterized protein